MFSQNGLTNSAMSAVSALSIGLVGYSSEKFIQTGWLSRTNWRKLFETIARVGLALSTGLVPLMSNNPSAIISLLLLGNFFHGFNAGGSHPIIGEMSRNFPATIFAIITAFTNLTAAFVPVLVGVIIDLNIEGLEEHTKWGFIFCTVAALTGISALVFVVFASAERQPWDYEDTRSSSTVSDINLNRKISEILDRKVSVCIRM